MTKLKAFPYFGGKLSHLNFILEHLPYTERYIEPFGGSAAVLLNREPSPIETYNDHTDTDGVEQYPVGELVTEGENDLADAIREAIGAEPDERIEVVLPAFERNDGVEVDWFPEDRMDIYSLCTASEETLKELGLRRWEDDHWLLPAEWYDHIPDGTLVEDINGEVEAFEHGATDNDRRFGVLPYGIKRYVDAETDHNPK